MLSSLITACRPRQWVKNLFVAAALVFSKRLLERETTLRTLCAIAIFCAISSAVYLWNDIVDIEKDRAHHKKSSRPIASGKLPISAAKVAAGTLAAGGLAFAYLLSPGFAATAAGYLLLNFAYSLLLKRIVYVDVLSIALGFILRVEAGAQAIFVDASPYLLLCTGLLATFLGLGKRAHELAAVSSQTGSTEQRPVLAGYHPRVLRAALYGMAFATLVAYALYTRSAHTIAFFGTTRMIFTTPFAAFGLFRFVRLVHADHAGDAPTDAMLRDIPFMANLGVWAVVVVAIIYLR